MTEELELVLKEGEKFRIQRDFFRMGQIAFFYAIFRRLHHSKNGAVKKQALLQRIFSNIIHSA